MRPFYDGKQAKHARLNYPRRMIPRARAPLVALAAINGFMIAWTALNLALALTGHDDARWQALAGLVGVVESVAMVGALILLVDARRADGRAWAALALALAAFALDVAGQWRARTLAPFSLALDSLLPLAPLADDARGLVATALALVGARLALGALRLVSAEPLVRRLGVDGAVRLFHGLAYASALLSLGLRAVIVLLIVRALRSPAAT
jgi:hypothetical protein